MHARSKAAPLAALALTLALGACSSGSGSDATSSTAAKATTTSSAPLATTTEAAATTTSGGSEVTSTTVDSTGTDEGTDTETSELDTLPDGVHYGYMAGLEKGKVEGQDVQVILWDEVEFLTGDAAVKAAKEDGKIPEDQDFIENDYYIRNQNQKVRRLAVVPDAQVYTLAGSGGSTDTVPSSVDEVWNQSYLFKIDVGNVRGITTISSIEAVFLP